MKKSITAGQIKQIVGFVRDVLKDIGLGFVQVKVFIADSARIKKFKEDFGELLKSTFQINPYIKERVKQTWFYPKNWQAKSVAEQVAKLVTLFPGINLSQAEQLPVNLTMPN